MKKKSVIIACITMSVMLFSSCNKKEIVDTAPPAPPAETQPEIVNEIADGKRVTSKTSPAEFDLDGDKKPDIRATLIYSDNYLNTDNVASELIYLTVLNPDAGIIVDGSIDIFAGLAVFPSFPRHKYAQVANLKEGNKINEKSIYSTTDTLIVSWYGCAHANKMGGNFDTPYLISSSLADKHTSKGFVGFKITNATGTFYGWMDMYLEVWANSNIDIGNGSNGGLFYWQHADHYNKPGIEIGVGEETE